jgi:hypothetical protein
VGIHPTVITLVALLSLGSAVLLSGGPARRDAGEARRPAHGRSQPGTRLERASFMRSANLAVSDHGLGWRITCSVPACSMTR